MRFHYFTSLRKLLPILVVLAKTVFFQILAFSILYTSFSNLINEFEHKNEIYDSYTNSVIHISNLLTVKELEYARALPSVQPIYQ